MRRYRLLLPIVILALLPLLGLGIACAGPLTPEEMQTLVDLDGNWQTKRGNDALMLAQKLGRECNLEAIVPLLQVRRSIVMNTFVNEAQHCDTSTPAMQALALDLAKDKSFDQDDESWDSRSQFYRLIHDYASRELWEILYASYRRSLIARQTQVVGALPVSMRNIGGTITPVSVPDIEEQIAQLLPLIGANNPCVGYGLVVFLRERHYVPALARLRDLYAKIPVTPTQCADDLTYTLASLQMPAATQAIVTRVKWLLDQPQSQYRDLDLITAISALGGQRIEAQADLDALSAEVLSRSMPAQLHARLATAFGKVIAMSHHATEFTVDNLWYWINAMNVELTRLFVQHGVNVNAVNSRGETPLTQAAWIANPQIVSVLVEGGADLNERNQMGKLPLNVACDVQSFGPNDLRIVRLTTYLLAHGARLDEADGSGMTALHHAAVNASVAVVEQLLTHSADINAKKAVELWNGAPSVSDTFVGATALHFAVRQSDRPMVTYLLDHGADPNARLQDGTTPLLIAAALSKDHQDMDEPLHRRRRGFPLSTGSHPE